LDEAFGLAVGAGPIRSSEAVADVPVLAESSDVSRAIRSAVIAQQTSRLRASGCEPVEGAQEKVGGGLPALVGKDLDVSQARVIVDADMDKLPADATHPGGAIPVDTVTDPADAPQLLDINVEKLSRRCVFVAPGRGSRRLEIPSPRQSVFSKDPADGGARNRAGSGDHHG